MQMLLYLDTVWKNGKSRYGSVLPAGILYVPAARPSVSAQWGDSGEKLEKERDKKLRMNGLVLDDPEVITGMEKQAQGVFIPVALKNGEPAKLDSVANLAQLGALTKKMEKLVVDMACSLRQGDVDAEPAPENTTPAPIAPTARCAAMSRRKKQTGREAGPEPGDGCGSGGSAGKGGGL